jgi:hypothetical protein
MSYPACFAWQRLGGVKPPLAHEMGKMPVFMHRLLFLSSESRQPTESEHLDLLQLLLLKGPMCLLVIVRLWVSQVCSGGQKRNANSEKLEAARHYIVRLSLAKCSLKLQVVSRA